MRPGDPGEETGSVEFRPVGERDREVIVGFCRKIWDGHDFIPQVFDRWVADPNAYFAALVVNGVASGCGRLLPLGERTAWLEALRIDPGARGRGLGRRMALHLFAEGRRRGFRDLWFSTYFRNDASIRISEEVGFRRVATWSLMELSFARNPEAGAKALGASPDPSVVSRDGLPPERHTLNGRFLTSDWMFLPPGISDRGRFLHQPVTLSRGACRIVVAANGKFPETTTDLALVEKVEGDDGRHCLQAAIRRAAETGRTTVQAMIPPEQDPALFLEAGFTSFEKLEDILLFRADAEALRL